MKDQKAITLAKLLIEGCTRGSTLRSWHPPVIPLMKDLCKMMGIRKINTTAYHPQCDGMVDRTLKTILRKHAATVGDEWDTYLYGVLYAYRNMSTGEKPSILLYEVDCRSPTEAALMPPVHLIEIYPTKEI